MPDTTGTPEDREQIRELYSRYAIYVDGGMFEDWLDLFTSDGVFESPVFGTYEGHSRLREFTAEYKEGYSGNSGCYAEFIPSHGVAA